MLDVSEVRRNGGVVIAKMRLVGALLGLHERNRPRLLLPPNRLSILTELKNQNMVQNTSSSLQH
jgi:hypothetical protein